MLTVQQPTPAVTPSVAAGLILAAAQLARQHGLPSATAEEIIAATGAGRSRAYELAAKVLALLPDLSRPPGRPATPPQPPSTTAEARAAIADEALRFVEEHPGCVHVCTKNRDYSELYRSFILKLRERHGDVTLRVFSQATHVPLGTLEDWLRPGRHPPEVEPQEPPSAPPVDATIPVIETLIHAWRSWRGDFTSFCAHARRDLRVHYSNSTISNLLHQQGARSPKRRRGRSPDDEASRGAFATSFAGAQWPGDGAQIIARVDNQEHRFNLEAFFDAYSAAWVGLNVSDTEDSAAVVAAYRDGVVTTGDEPLATLLDNRPSNHTDTVAEALANTIRLRATVRRPQNKCHVEGGFGLFSQAVPAIDVCTADSRELARQIAGLVATAFARGLNRRPRPDRGGKSRLELYVEPVSDEQKQLARQQLIDRLHKLELARLRRAARLDPAVCELLDRAFAELDLIDPQRHIRDAIALYPLEHIVEASAIFKGKRTAGTLPADVDARYFLGIVRNLAYTCEASCIIEALIEERLAARDRLLEPLVQQRDHILADDPDAVLQQLVKLLLSSQWALDQHFWIAAIADTINNGPAFEIQQRYRSVARRINTAFRIPCARRQHLTLMIARKIWPLRSVT